VKNIDSNGLMNKYKNKEKEKKVSFGKAHVHEY